MIYRAVVPFTVTLNGPNTPLFDVEYLRNGERWKRAILNGVMSHDLE